MYLPESLINKRGLTLIYETLPRTRAPGEYAQHIHPHQAAISSSALAAPAATAPIARTTTLPAMTRVSSRGAEVGCPMYFLNSCALAGPETPEVEWNAACILTYYFALLNIIAFTIFTYHYVSIFTLLFHQYHTILHTSDYVLLRIHLYLFYHCCVIIMSLIRHYKWKIL